MPFVIREHAHLLDIINGIPFAAHPAGSISAEMPEEHTPLFLAVPGFRLALEQEVPGYTPPPAAPVPPAAAPPVTPSVDDKPKAQTGKARSKKPDAAAKPAEVTEPATPPVTDAADAAEDPETLF